MNIGVPMGLQLRSRRQWRQILDGCRELDLSGAALIRVERGLQKATHMDELAEKFEEKQEMRSHLKRTAAIAAVMLIVLLVVFVGALKPERFEQAHHAVEFADDMFEWLRHLF
jgi:hypothetical protein